MSIVQTEDIFGGEQHLEGRRISVLQIADRVIDAGQSPEYIADQLDISLTEVYRSLAYYYGHIEEMDSIRDRHRELEAELESVSLSPPETIDSSQWL